MHIVYLLSHTVLMANETGGVLRIFKSYMEMARYSGHKVTLYSGSDQFNLTSVDLVHVAPCDLGMLGVVRVLKRRHIPFVISPILDKIYPNYAIRMVVWGDKLIGRLYRSHLGAAREICGLASGVCLMSTHEGSRITTGLGVHPRIMKVVQPAILWDAVPADSNLCQKLCGPNEFVLFAGDLSNPRKNVLRLIQAASRCNLPLVLVGPLNDSEYGKRVSKAIQGASNVKYLGVIPRELLFSAMRNCRVFALPSLMEGIGMAAVEAGSLGARVVITQNGGPPDYFGSLAWYVNPYSVRSISDGLLKAWNTNETPPLAEFLKRTLSITALAPRLDAFYRQVLVS